MRKIHALRSEGVSWCGRACPPSEGSVAFNFTTCRDCAREICCVLYGYAKPGNLNAFRVAIWAWWKLKCPRTDQLFDVRNRGREFLGPFNEDEFYRKAYTVFLRR